MKRCSIKKGSIASAIGYSPEDAAPRLLATGRDRTAERIIAIAEQAGVAVIEDPALAALLDSGVRPGDMIPVWCWEATAKILAFVLTKGNL
ncbi:MAG: EscU/YscU/HrcU family type III secretion system export apparatus switch protein [Treponema sp.]|jgi:flagellar biosynthesis protein|nr:EscU/YscU/HrcU family type III secretion system export apparatus switch protein [Treponema sp.]